MELKKGLLFLRWSTVASYTNALDLFPGQRVVGLVKTTKIMLRINLKKIQARTNMKPVGSEFNKFMEYYNNSSNEVKNDKQRMCCFR
uniref:Uncharacterized protein n=1 Tax=Meloidogyne enterolobii TaxID=390850 RepID=A0A6V7WDT8_MELEN|nr:unnamed protein product [Meloidogyne enterolobii]